MRIFYLLILIVLSLVAFSQEPVGNIYWIRFNSKSGTPYSIENPETFLSQRSLDRKHRMGIEIDSTDLPVNPAFIDSLEDFGIYVKHTSRWMNGAIGVLDQEKSIDSLYEFNFIDTVILRRTTPMKSIRNKFEIIDSLDESSEYGEALTQIALMNGEKLHEFSKGEGIQIAVLDAGFLNVDNIEKFKPLFNEGRILGTNDFVSPGNDVFTEHYHGTMVLSSMAVNIPGEYVGTAPEASYWLFRTEDVYYEYPAEEDYWMVAVERADSIGCDVINTSLGYTTFDNSDFDHTWEEFNGDSIRMAKTANMAVDKGMVLVCSAGNSGNSSWYYISAPSEAKNVLSVAAVNSSGTIAGFSSRGFDQPELPPKPDISAMGSLVRIVNDLGDYQDASGTSFSSPIAAGMAACLVDLYPNYTAHEIIRSIRESGNRYPEHSPEYGYGIPDFYYAYEQLKGAGIETTESIQTEIFPNPFTEYLHLYNTTGFHQIKLYNVYGQIKFMQPLNSDHFTDRRIFNLSFLPNGIYILNLVGEGNNYSQKIVKY